MWGRERPYSAGVAAGGGLAEGGVEMVVYDVFGREAGKHGGWDVLPSNRMILLDISGYASGMYIAVVRDQKGRRYTGKFVVAR